MRAFQISASLEQVSAGLQESIEQSGLRFSVSQNRFHPGSVPGTGPVPGGSAGCASFRTEWISGCGSLSDEHVGSGSFSAHRFQRVNDAVLEDQLITQRVAEGLVSIQQLLLYSSVCGTGLDCVPLAGVVTEEEIAAILLDEAAALSVRLKKQLTARLIPVPGKAVGDATQFSFEYFANSCILPSESSGLERLLAAGNYLPMLPRN